MVESAAGNWYRFVIGGGVTGSFTFFSSFIDIAYIIQLLLGGSLKTPSQADSESLQAKWVKNLSDLSLRAGDILSVVEHARSFKAHQLDQPLYPPLLPFPRSYSKLYLRLIICARRKAKYVNKG